VPDGLIGSVEIVGHDELVALMVRAGATAQPMLARVLKEEADLIMRNSQEEVPLRFGALKNSARVQNPVFAGGEVSVTLSYGSSAVAYAMYQHAGQREDGSHVVRNYGMSAPGGNAAGNGKKKQYLSDPVEAAIPGMDARLAMKLEEILGG
jgi:hypothetical protein